MDPKNGAAESMSKNCMILYPEKPCHISLQRVYYGSLVFRQRDHEKLLDALKMELIVCNSTTPAPQESESDESLIEAVFRIPADNRLQLEVGGWHDRATDCLTFTVARFPNDLRSHVRRIALLKRHKNEAALHGALVDLFIVLQGKGRPLRERMLAASKPVLRKENYFFLSEFLDTGLSALDALPLPRHSVLSKGVTGTSQLVQKSHARSTLMQDPLTQARDRI